MRKCSTSSQGGISKFWQGFILIAVRRVIHCDSIQCRWQPLFWFIAGRIEIASSIHIMLERCLSASVLVAVPLYVWNSSGCPPFPAIFFPPRSFQLFPAHPIFVLVRLARSSFPLCLSVWSCHSTAMILCLTGLT